MSPVTLVVALLPALSFVLLWCLISLRRQQLGMNCLSKRGTFVVAFLAFQALLLLITEVLSMGANLTSETTTLAWVVAGASLGALLTATTDLSRVRSSMRWSVSVSGLFRELRGLPRESAVAGILIAAIMIVLVIIGWLYPPNNTDSLVYHLPRVSHWIQQASVEHFATHYTAQIELSPLHEFNMLHLHVLGGSDRADGYVQLVAFVVCIVAASEIARLLGVRPVTQMLAALICAVIPSAILEATSTQNNLFAAAIGAGMVVAILAWVPTQNWLWLALTLGLSVGLGYMAKGLVLPLVGPVVILLAVRLITLETRRLSWRTAFRRAALALAVVLASAALMAGPFLNRNRDLFGSFSGPISSGVLNTEISSRDGLANVLRSVAVNFRIGNAQGGIDTLVGNIVRGSLREVHGLLDVPLDDERFMMWTDYDAFRSDDYTDATRLEEYGANPWHVLLMLVAGAILICLAVRRRQAASVPLLMAAGLVLGFVLFSGTAKWSVFVTRYQVPSLVIWAPLIAVSIAIFRRTSIIITLLLVVACLPQLLSNDARSLMKSRTSTQSDLDVYFIRPGVADYVDARDAIVDSGCTRLGIANWILLEYPIWAGLEHSNWPGQIEHVNVENESAVFERQDFEPCALIWEPGRPTSPPDTAWPVVPYGRLALAISPDVTDRSN